MAARETDTAHEVIVDPEFGYRRLEPMPSAEEFERFYESQYYDLLRQGGRAPELRRLMAGGEEAERERAWLRETLYADISAELEAHGSGRRVLDVGCGQGELLQWLAEQGFEPHGIEPSDDAAALARERGLDVKTATLEELVEEPGQRGSYDAVLLLNVLEHVPEAAETLRRIHGLLKPGGFLYIRVPNDFNPLQLAAHEKVGGKRWWIAVPDHVNYFDIDSLTALVRRVGFEPVDVQADFPMELFLLMGMNYIADRELGGTCHAHRVEAEMSMPAEARRRLFRAFAEARIGRNQRVLVRKVRDQAAPPPAQAGLPAERGHYRYVPLRRDDIETLRGFRNAQMDVLRQSRPLSREHQERWFDEVVLPAQGAERPPFLLVSILEGERFVGYGGLTNVDWDAGRAEVSFLVDPARAADEETYAEDMSAFLDFLATWAFRDLSLRRLFTETYAFREFHISLLERAGFIEEGRLRLHAQKNGEAVDSIMHGLLASDWEAR